MKTYGLIGKNIDYSFSRNYFSNKFFLEKIENSQYVNFDIDNLVELNKIFNNKVNGLNVTIPYKEAIISHLSYLDINAKAIGAVNTIKIIDNKFIGYNTDWIGFLNSIKPLLKPHHSKALILGSGGASKAIKYALSKLNLEYKTVSRTAGDFTYLDLNQKIINQFQIIINCTPIGTFPNVKDAPNIPYEYINSQHLAYDLIYNPTETQFLINCKNQGAQIKNGLEMLEIQAEESWKIWND